ncbi:DEAD/DEAH box helicase [Aerococcaceae bacterium NML201209]|nr:DEAD/DEAH box helicase [Aerococcaceae bacterium NML201209]
MPIKLYDYQQSLVDKARNAYRDGYKSPCIVAPCGAGKSVMIAEIVRLATANQKQVLFLVHRKELVDQIEHTLIHNDVDMQYVTLGMVMTVVRRLETYPKFDLIVVDENHHVLAKTYRKILAHFDTKVIGFTATPVRLNGDGLGDINDILIEEVDAEWLIEHKRLAPYRYFAPKLIDDSQLKTSRTKEFDNHSVDKAMTVTVYGDAIAHYKRLADGQQTIVYCHSVKASETLAALFNSHGISAKHIDGTTPKIEREAIIQQFRNQEIAVLTNVDLIGEGFDVPDCSCVILLRPTQSLSLHIQQSMRAMRYKPDKTAIIIDHVGNGMRHGLPDSQRTWSLEGKQKKQEATIKVKECQECLAVYHSTEKRCPLCGFEPPVIEVTRKIEAIDTELQEVKKDDFQLVVDTREPSDCRTMKELYELAKNKGYKKGWAWYQGKAMGLI